MQYIFIIPFFFSLYYVMQGRTDKAFLNVYLPCLFVLPHYFSFRIPHVPVWSAAEVALMPIAVSVLIRPVTPWKFRRMDLFLVLFMISAAISELTREYNPKDGLYLWLDEFVQMFCTYVVGRQLIEPRLRLETIKRIIFLLVAITPFVFIEFLIGRNIWLQLSGYMLGWASAGWSEQVRGGHTRVAACFGQAILSGMVFLAGIALNYYLVQIYKRNKTRLGPWMSKLQQFRIPFLLLPLFLFMTSSRGPMICAVFCFMVMQIPRFKKLITGAVLFTVVMAVGGFAVYTYFQKYTTVENTQDLDEEQSSAVYRKEMAKNYAPILEDGGWLGYGAMSHPSARNQASVDDNYMLVQLAQGKLGLYLFILIACESVFSMIEYSFRFKSRETIYLVFCMLGALAGLFATLKNVYLGEQLPQVIFLLVGWSQSLQDTGHAGATRHASPEPKFRFKRVIA